MKNATRLSRRRLIRHHIDKITSSEYIRILILRTIGNFLILASLFMIGKTFYIPAKEEFRFALDQFTKKKYVVSLKPIPQPTPAPQKGLLAKALNFNNTQVLTPEDPNFDIIIPKIAANSKIIPNVDAADEKNYLPALQEGVAQAAGTAYPGEGGHIFLFAHSTDYFWNVSRYNAVFFLLHQLVKGDEVDLFYKGQRYVYKVIGTQVVDPSQTQYLTRKTNREFLTLQTCWPPGTTLQRLLVFAVRVTE